MQEIVDYNLIHTEEQKITQISNNRVMVKQILVQPFQRLIK